MDRIVLSGIRAFGRHGVPDEERRHPQEFEIELACSVDARAAASADDIGSTIDYVRLRDIAVAEVESASYRLLETLAERIASRILDEASPAWIRVRATKLRPPGMGSPASVEVERRASDAPRVSAPVELHVPDFAPAKRFYGGLGFAVAREEPAGGANGYLVMTHGADVLRFWPGTEAVEGHHYFGRYPPTTKRGYGVEIVLTFEDLDAAFASAQELGTIVEPIRVRPWGLRDFRVEDPYGFYVRCTEPHDPRVAGSGTA